MRKVLYIDALAILLLLVGRLYLSGPIVVDREGAFYTGLHNSLYFLDQAKWDWAEKEHKAENDVPTMAELLPYMGDHRPLIDRFTALGVRYTITPFGEEYHQSDVATLTKDIRFSAGFCRFYPAGTKYSIQGERVNPQVPFWFGYFEQNWAIMVPLWILTFVVGNAIFLVIWFCRRAIRAKTATRGETTGSQREGGVEPPQPGL
jgi:hypothetical protein